MKTRIKRGERLTISGLIWRILDFLHCPANGQTFPLSVIVRYNPTRIYQVFKFPKLPLQ